MSTTTSREYLKKLDQQQAEINAVLSALAQTLLELQLTQIITQYETLLNDPVSDTVTRQFLTELRAQLMGGKTPNQIAAEEQHATTLYLPQGSLTAVREATLQLRRFADQLRSRHNLPGEDAAAAPILNVLTLLRSTEAIFENAPDENERMKTAMTIALFQTWLKERDRIYNITLNDTKRGVHVLPFAEVANWIAEKLGMNVPQVYVLKKHCQVLTYKKMPSGIQGKILNKKQKIFITLHAAEELLDGCIAFQQLNRNPLP